MIEMEKADFDSFRFFDKVRGLGVNPKTLGLDAYAAFLMAETGSGYTQAIQEGCSDDELRAYLLDPHGGSVEIDANAMCGLDKEDLRAVVLSGVYTEFLGRFGDELFTPSCVARLAVRLLDVHSDERVADLCCGVGRFLLEAANSGGSDIYGIDINPQAAMMAKATLALAGTSGEIEVGDVLSHASKGSYDKVFSSFPFGMRLSNLDGNGAYYDMAKSGKEGFGRPLSADWLFALAAYDSLSEGGSALVVMTNGALSNGADACARKYFVDNSMVKAVIALPGALFQSTSIPVTAVLIGENEGSVRVVDASDLCVPKRRWNWMGDDEIDEVLRRLEEDGVNSRSVSQEEFARNEYNLSPARYLGRELELENPASIGDIALAIERGAGYRASELDDMATLEDTGMSYLKLGDICDGIIGGNLSHLGKLDPKTQKQWLRTGDLVISKNGAPFKVAVADVPEDRKVLANGNLYIIRLDPSKADPYYVAAFLASEDGKEVMNRETVGTAIPNLPLANLRRMQISLPPLEKQKRIGELYHARLDEIEVLRIKLEKARIAAAETYDEAVGR